MSGLNTYCVVKRISNVKGSRDELVEGKCCMCVVRVRSGGSIPI